LSPLAYHTPITDPPTLADRKASPLCSCSHCAFRAASASTTLTGAKQLVEYLRRLGFVVMKRPAIGGRARV
jgi:hypothetical protein